MEFTEEEYLAHYGILRRSGRYPWGSGGPEYASNKSFLGYVQELKKSGMSEVDIARGMGISTTELRAARSIARNEENAAKIGQAEKLRALGNSHKAIAAEMNLAGESSVRALLADGQKDRNDILTATANTLKSEVDAKHFVDVGAGVDAHLGISSTKLNTALAVLKEQGYEVHDLKILQAGTGLYTNSKVLALPGTARVDVFKNRDKVQQLGMITEDNGRTYEPVFDGKNNIRIDPKRVGINYAEDGGNKADGVIYVRPGVKDVSLGNANYAQVRIAVGDGHYIKGMAMYKDGLPAGTDLLFNTIKSNTGNKLDALKKVSDDPDNPFGAVVRQLKEPDASGAKKPYSAMNIVNEEGDWSTWSRSLSSQMLSKQNRALVKDQLDMTFERRTAEFDRLSRLTNPTIRKDLLTKFGDETDSAAVHLKAAALPKQESRVILPISSMPPSQIYAPGFRNGDRVVLVRHPHGGTFEIPELTVNNRQPEAKKLLGEAKDAVGIHHSVAERLSGADFDGDSVLVIPNNHAKVKTTPALEQLKNFDPRTQYKAYEGMPKMSAKTKQLEMGKVSNLISDMTIKGASTEDISRALKHSMVVIDAEKHNLNYKQSAIDNGISSLVQKYQAKPDGRSGGASTLISRATSQKDVPVRKARSAAAGGAIDKTTGKRVFVDTGELKRTKDGSLVPRTIKSKKLAETDDAHTLSSGTAVERLYADHSNRLKDLANRARLEAVNTPNAKYSPSAKKVYGPEVSRLNSALNLAERNAPLERQAQTIANTMIKASRDAHPDMDETTLKKVKSRSLTEARNRTGAKKERIEISDREWEAIQAGAISPSKLERILANANIDRVRELATPKVEIKMTSAKTTRARQMLGDGYSRAEVADALGVSVSTLEKATGGET